MAENEKQVGGSPMDPGATADVGKSPGIGTVNVNSRTAIDSSAFKELNSEFKKLSTHITKFQADLPKLIEGTKKWASELNKVAKGMSAASKGGAGGGSYFPEAGSATNVNSGNSYNVSKTVNVYQGGGGGGGGRLVDPKTGLMKPDPGQAWDAIKNLAGSAINAMDARAARGASYSLGADRMNMMYQQMSGLSQNQTYKTYREPLQKYKLGVGGINELLNLQATTGLNAQRQAGSVEAMRASSGFQYSTADIAAQTRALGSAQSSNQMFMMLGTGMYGVGGKQRTQQEVYQDVIKRTGLTNDKMLKGAFQQGSMTRERLRQSGVPEDQIDSILQYAQQNVAYQKKGGKGFYDPGNKEQRSFMGVEKNQYATQFEETERVKVGREENFYKRQNDNFAAAERNTQAIEKLTTKIEELTSGLIGANIATKPGRGFLGSVTKWGKKIAGAGMMAAAALGAAPTGGASLSLGFAGAGLMASGDGPPEGGGKGGPNNSKVTTSGSQAPNVKKSAGALSQLNSRFAQKVQAMLEENPRLYIGNGLRSSAQQKAMFLDRYKPTNQQTDLKWNGTYWKHVKGAAAAPPGMSMHEIGLAADLGPESEFPWIVENAARFGLRHFADVNNEPWHVQPVELPGSRREYEAAGAPWGTKGEKFDPNSIIIGGAASALSESAPGAGGSSSGFKWSGMNMGEILNTSAHNAAFGTSSGGSKGSTRRGSAGTGSTKGKTLGGIEVARIFYNAGFRGADLVKAVAIAHRESRFNTGAYNPDVTTKDKSFGLMQINMIGNLGPARRKQFGIKSDEELLDPNVNARAAYAIYKSSNKSFHAWGEYKGMDSSAHTNSAAAAKYVKSAGYNTTGDPVKVNSAGAGAPIAMGGGTTMVGGASYNITVAPNISLQGGAGGTYDLPKLARDVATLMEREIRLTMLRTT